jgi:hypothetical protein
VEARRFGIDATRQQLTWRCRAERSRLCGKPGQAAEYGVEQGAKARTLVAAGEDRGGLLLENSMTDFVRCTFQERTHTFLGRFHMKL